MSNKEHINIGLLPLGNVISLLGDEKKRKKRVHIYRHELLGMFGMAFTYVLFQLMFPT